MIQALIPGMGAIELHSLVLDMNGTITTDGALIPGVDARIRILKTKLSVYLLTADTFGTASTVAAELGINLQRIDPLEGGADKREFVKRLGKDKTIAIGNGINDAMMMSEAILSIAVIGQEGCAGKTLQNAAIVCKDILDALDLLLQEKRLVATLRA
jgi:P-type E1-E2 ATPase